jgi:hypothetical protein
VIIGHWNFEMAKSKRLRNGIGAKVSVYKKCLHPQKDICAKYPNANKGEVLNELLVVGQEEKTVNNRQHVCRHVTRQF